MPDLTNGEGTPNKNTEATPTGSSPTIDDSNGVVQDFDPSKLSNEAFEKVWEDKRIWTHPRFKDLNEKAKKAAEYEDLQNKQREQKLLEEKKYEELLNERTKEIATLKAENETSRINISVVNEAQKLGAIDMDVVLQVLDRSEIKLSDSGIEGVAQALEKLKEQKGYLFGQNVQTKIGAGSNPGKPLTGTRFKLSQIQNPAFYREHEKEITDAINNGLVENDMPGQK